MMVEMTMAMKSNKELIDELRANLYLAPVDVPVRTQYAIQSTSTKLWVGAGASQHWVDREHARRFEFMTSALSYAMGMGFNLDSISVEAV